MAADGSVVFSVDLDDKDAQKELNKLVKKIDTLNDKIYQKQQDKMPLAKQSAEIAANLDAAKATLDSMHSGKEFFYGGFHQGTGKHCEIFAKRV